MAAQLGADFPEIRLERENAGRTIEPAFDGPP